MKCKTVSKLSYTLLKLTHCYIKSIFDKKKINLICKVYTLLWLINIAVSLKFGKNTVLQGLIGLSWICKNFRALFHTTWIYIKIIYEKTWYEYNQANTRIVKSATYNLIVKSATYNLELSSQNTFKIISCKANCLKHEAPV